MLDNSSLNVLKVLNVQMQGQVPGRRGPHLCCMPPSCCHAGICGWVLDPDRYPRQRQFCPCCCVCPCMHVAVPCVAARSRDDSSPEAPPYVHVARSFAAPRHGRRSPAPAATLPSQAPSYTHHLSSLPTCLHTCCLVPASHPTTVRTCVRCAQVGDPAQEALAGAHAAGAHQLRTAQPDEHLRGKEQRRGRNTVLSQCQWHEVGPAARLLQIILPCKPPSPLHHQPAPLGLSSLSPRLPAMSPAPRLHPVRQQARQGPCRSGQQNTGDTKCPSHGASPFFMQKSLSATLLTNWVPLLPGS